MRFLILISNRILRRCGGRKYSFRSITEHRCISQRQDETKLENVTVEEKSNGKHNNFIFLQALIQENKTIIRNTL